PGRIHRNGLEARMPGDRDLRGPAKVAGAVAADIAVIANRKQGSVRTEFDSCRRVVKFPIAHDLPAGRDLEHNHVLGSSSGKAAGRRKRVPNTLLVGRSESEQGPTPGPFDEV